MNSSSRWVVLTLAACLGVVAPQCGEEGGSDLIGDDSAADTDVDTDSDSDTDTDTDVDTDTDIDTDTDTDTDIDTDTDTDTDADTDTDTDSDSDVDTNPECVDEDSDWWCSSLDCNDSDSSVHPNQAEVPDNGIDDDCDGQTDEFEDTETQYIGPTIPETCEEAAVATTTVGCLFYAVDLDTHDSLEVSQQYAVAVSNVNETDTATVEVYRGNTGLDSFDFETSATVGPMDLHTFNLPDHHTSSSGKLVKGTYKIVSDVPIIAYQFNPVDGSASYLSDASMLIPATSLSQDYDVVGWKRTNCGGVNPADGTMRPYFTVVATLDGTEVTIDPIMAPIAGIDVPSSADPFTVNLNEGDVVEVAALNFGDTMSGSRVEANDDHPIAVFSGQECTYIPETICCCDHLEEQLPGLKFWGKEFVASRMPVRSTSATTEDVLWQVYASEDATEVIFSASAGVVGLPISPTTMNQGDILEFYVHGTSTAPGDFFIDADKPIGVMQYMIGAQNPNAGNTGDPAMVYVSPAEQFLPRYVVLVPSTWINDALVITRHAGIGVLLDGLPVADSSFIDVASSGYEAARVNVSDGVHTLESDDDEYGLAVIVVGWDSYDSYAYAGGMGLAAINPNVD